MRGALSASAEVKMPDPPLLVLGTHNAKKGAELIRLLEPLGISTRTLVEYPQAIEVIEDGESFAANAKKKSCEQARHLGLWVLAEDSGVCVDAMEGRPGIYSARFAGPQASDAENNRLLLEQLKDVPQIRRGAHYTCHAAICDPEGNLQASSEAYCRGRIRTQEAGTGGFGYDPLFEVLEYHRTFGQLGPNLKSAISHRSRAIAKLLPELRKLLRAGNWSPPVDPA